MYYTVNTAVVGYCGTQIPETEENDGQMKTESGSESTDLYGKD